MSSEHVCLSALYQHDQFQIMASASHMSQESPPPFAAVFAEVEVDVETGLVRVVKLVEAIDCGQAINPAMAEGQIDGAAVQGIGYALFERMPFDETGRMQFRSFRDYTIATAIDVPEIVTILVPTHEPTGPFGAKAVAEIPISGPAPADRKRRGRRRRRADSRAAAHTRAGARRSRPGEAALIDQPALPSPRRGSGAGAGGCALITLALLAGVVIGLLVFRLTQVGGLRFGRPAAQPRPVAARGDLAEDEKGTIALFREASPSVVYITTLARRIDFWTRNVVEIPQGTGSGFVWDEDGHIVTNFHVIQDAGGGRGDARRARQRRGDARRGGARQGPGRAQDLGAHEHRCAPIPIGTSTDLQVGQKVFAIGNPFGLDQTLTTGVVAALGREISASPAGRSRTSSRPTRRSTPATPAGPLLDSAGRLIGVNTAIYSPSGSSAGIGFAVPVDTVNRVVPQLIAHGRIVGPSSA